MRARCLAAVLLCVVNCVPPAAEARMLQEDTLTRTVYSAASVTDPLMYTSYRVWNLKIGDVPGLTARETAPFVLTTGNTVYVPANGVQHSEFYTPTGSGSDYLYAGGRRYRWSPVELTAGTATPLVPLDALINVPNTGTLTWSPVVGRIMYTDTGWQSHVEDLDARPNVLGPCATPFNCTWPGVVNGTAAVQVQFSLQVFGIGLPPGFRVADVHEIAVGDMTLSTRGGTQVVCRGTACRAPVWSHTTNDTVIIGLDAGVAYLVVHWRADGYGTVLPAWSGASDMMVVGRYDWHFITALLFGSIVWFVVAAPDEFAVTLRNDRFPIGELVYRTFVVAMTILAGVSTVALVADTTWALDRRLRRSSLVAFTDTEATAVAAVAAVVSVAYTIAAFVAAVWPLSSTSSGGLSRLDTGRMVLSVLFTPHVLFATTLRTIGDTIYGGMLYLSFFIGAVTVVLIACSLGAAGAAWVKHPDNRLIGAAVVIGLVLGMMAVAVVGVVSIYPVIGVLDDLEAYRGVVTGTVTTMFIFPGFGVCLTALHPVVATATARARV